MVLLPMQDVTGQIFRCLYVPEPMPISQLAKAMEEADFLAAPWRDPTAEVPLAHLQERFEGRLLVAEPWRLAFPEAGVLISSSISGGNLKSRFLQSAEQAPSRCWLLAEPLCMAFPLPCPDGQGTPAELPKDPGFFSESLGCRYVHSPEQVILFDTDETLELKRQWAMEAGFVGCIDMQKRRR